MRPFICGFVVSAATVTGVAGTAGATPPLDVSAETLAQGQIPAGLLPSVPATDLVARRITIGPGGTTGWHYHDGPVAGFVAAGTLTHPGPDCVPVIYRTGDVIVEPAGGWNVHAGWNSGAVPVVLYVVYAPPTGDPLFRDAPAPDCAG